jgi:hypothetical protein
MNDFDFRDYENQAHQLRRAEIARLAGEFGCELRRLANRLLQRPAPACVPARRIAA